MFEKRRGPCARWLLLSGLLCACGAEPPPAERNAILISIDSLRADHLGCYGYGPPTSPGLDAFAAEGVLFRHAYATSPWTLPSHVSMFTGLYADTHGVAEENVSLKRSAETLGGRLGRHGYQTGAIVCAPMMSPEFGLQHGFETYDTELVGETFLEARGMKVGPDVTRKALEWLDARGERPFFLFLHYWDVHYDYNPPDAYVELFDPGYAGALDGLDIYNRTDIVPGMAAQDLAHLIALYDGEIRYTDDAIRDLLEGLPARGLDETTMVWITSDHGEEFLDHGGKGHTHTCYEELVRIPLLARVPWEQRRQPVVEEPVSLIDLFPTFLELLGVALGETFVQGRSLAGPLRGDKGLAPRFLLAQTLRGKQAGYGATPLLWTAFLARNQEKLHQLWPRGGEMHFQLFDLGSDGAERSDLAGQNPARTRQIAAELLRIQKVNFDLQQGLGLTEPRVLSPELLDTLRGLGYVER